MTGMVCWYDVLHEYMYGERTELVSWHGAYCIRCTNGCKGGGCLLHQG